MIDLNKILAESSDCEFKEMLEVKKPKSWLKTISAFANESGGVLIFGMRDDKTVVGLSDIKGVIDRVSKILKEKIDPQPKVDFKVDQTKDGKDILILEVSSGKDTPYYYSSDGNRIAYVRIGSDSQQSSSNRLNELILRGKNLSYDQLTTDIKIENISFTILNSTFKRIKNINLSLSDYKAFDLCKTDGTVTNAGLLFSDDCPILQARIFCTHWDGLDKSGGIDDAIDDKEFECDLVSQLIKSHDFIKMNSKIRWKKMSNYRINKPDYSDRAVFEALANAIMHRDYSIIGSEIHVDMYDDRLEIYSPGGMPDGSLIQDKQIEKVDSVRRNPLIADIFYRLNYVERRGSGLKKICNEISNLYDYSVEAKPQFESTKSSFRVIMKNMNYKLATVTDKTENMTDIIDKVTDKMEDVSDIINTITNEMKIKLTKKEKSFIIMLLPYLEVNEWITNKIAREITQLSEISVKRFFRSLTDKMIFISNGDHKARKYKLYISLKYSTHT